MSENIFNIPYSRTPLGDLRMAGLQSEVLIPQLDRMQISGVVLKEDIYASSPYCTLSEGYFESFLSHCLGKGLSISKHVVGVGNVVLFSAYEKKFIRLPLQKPLQILCKAHCDDSYIFGEPSSIVLTPGPMQYIISSLPCDKNVPNPPIDISYLERLRQSDPYDIDVMLVRRPSTRSSITTTWMETVLERLAQEGTEIFA